MDVVSPEAFAAKICAVVALSNMLGVLIYRAGRRRPASCSQADNYRAGVHSLPAERRPKACPGPPRRYHRTGMALTTAIRAPRGRAITCKGWHQEAALRMLHNNLDPEVAEKPG